jgi:tRNA (adenine22-N1)-methyltransferase
LKLGKRLQQIESMVTSQYDHIWDCCCDHGLLGAALLSKKVAPHIHFVDVVPELINQLKNKLTQFFPENSNSQWQVHCIDVTKLPLQKFVGKHLIIIAGVGGDLMSGFIKLICQNNPTADFDFLLCPVHHQFTLRQQLIQLDFCLKTEALIFENERYYEALLVSKTAHHSGLKINPVGNLIWQASTPEQLKHANNYLNKIRAHYQRMKLNCDSEIQYIIDAYNAVIL